MYFKSSVLNIILLGGLLLGAANAIAEDAQAPSKQASLDSILSYKAKYPWDVMANNPYNDYEYGDSDTDSEADIENTLKRARWNVCSEMARITELVAGNVKAAKESHGELTDEDIKKNFFANYPLDNGNFQDVINQKTLDLAFKMWASYTGEVNNVVIEQAAWDWCIKQDLSHFKDL